MKGCGGKSFLFCLRQPMYQGECLWIELRALGLCFFPQGGRISGIDFQGRTEVFQCSLGFTAADSQAAEFRVSQRILWPQAEIGLVSLLHLLKALCVHKCACVSAQQIGVYWMLIDKELQDGARCIRIGRLGQQHVQKSARIRIVRIQRKRTFQQHNCLVVFAHQQQRSSPSGEHFAISRQKGGSGSITLRCVR